MMLGYFFSALAGAVGMLLSLAAVAVLRKRGLKNATNSVVHAREHVVAVVKSAGGKKRAIHSK